MGAFEGLTQYFGRPLQDIAREYGYHQSNIIILEGDLTRLRREYPQIYSNLLSCKHHADRRTPLEYGRDLIASWIYEDYFLEAIRNEHFQVTLGGADRNRMILAAANTNTAADYVISYGQGNSISLELANDYTNFWYNREILHLRDDKYRRLSNSHSLLMAISLTADHPIFALYDFRNPVPARFIADHKPFGHKPAYELSIPRGVQQAYSIPDIINRIRGLLQQVV